MRLCARYLHSKLKKKPNGEGEPESWEFYIKKPESYYVGPEWVKVGPGYIVKTKYTPQGYTKEEALKDASGPRGCFLQFASRYDYEFYYTSRR